MSEEPGIVVVASRIEPAELARLTGRFFGDEEIRESVTRIVFDLVGRGEAA